MNHESRTKKTMKDYYKILGLRETASAGEIRARWIELMRELHPDGKGEGEAENPQLKEINEAYGVLKHSSTRAEYDLRRAYYRRKKASFLRKMILSPGILIAFLIVGLIYSKRTEVPLLPESTSPSTRASINIHVNPPSPPLMGDNRASNDIRLPNDLNSIGKSPSVLDGKESTTARKPPVSGAKEPKSPATSAEKPISVAHLSSAAAQKNQPAQPKLHPRIRESEPSANVQRDIPPETSNAMDTVKSLPPLVKSESAATTQNTGAQTSPVKNLEDRESPTSLEESSTKTDPSNALISVAQLKQPSSGITEGEVKQFLEHYKERYVHQDIDDFLPLFSLKAVQNGRYRFDEIKKIYLDFFHQSHELRYHLEDTRIEIYQEVLISGLFYEHAALVEARYQVDQTLVKKGEKKVWKGDIRWILVRENGILKILYLDYKQQNSP